MRKGRNRRHREAREMKYQATDLGAFEPAVAVECDECGRTPCAEWCMADDYEDARS